MTSLTVTSAVQLAARLRAGACGDPAFLFSGAASPLAPESPEGSLDDPHSAEKRLAAGMMLASAKKRRKQSKPVRIHALDEVEGEAVPLALTPRAEPEQLACPHCSRAFSQQGELAHHLETQHARGGERAASAGESGTLGSELPLNLSNQWRERDATETQGQPPASQMHENYGYGRAGESRDGYSTSQRRGSESHDPYRASYVKGSESHDEYRTNQRRSSEAHDDYRTNQRRGSESHDEYRSHQRRDSQSAGVEDCRVGQPRDGEPQEDYRDGQRRDSILSCPEDSRGRQSEQDALQTLSSLQRKYNTPGYLPYRQPPLLLPFLSQQMGQPPAAPTDGKIFNPEAFCELCGKEFCNKYFLRTHKANKHGVYADAPRSPPAGSALLAQQLATSGRQLSPSAESRDSGRPSSEAEAAARPASDTFCQPCQKEFCDTFFLRQHRATVHGETETSEEAPRPPVYRAPREPEQGELTRPEPSDPYDARQLSELPAPAANGRKGESPRSFSREQLRLMGVTNADAFCNICCKEFCSKYFLKVHRYKMHQIGSPPPERERPPSGSASGSGGGGGGGAGSSGGSAAPPLSCPPLEKLLEAPLRDSFPKDCDQCGRPFQSSYLLQMHKYYFHGLGQQFAGGLLPPADRPPPPPPLPPKKSKSKKKDNFGDDLKKLQGMIKGLHDKKSQVVSCHVCAKTLENKTVLQAHLMTEHGMFQSQEEIIIPKPPVPSTSKATSGSKERPDKSQSSGAGETFCSICKKDFYAKFFLQQHMQTAHGIQAGATLSETAFLARIRHEVESQKKPERPKPASTSRSYCEICKKELCNKYFMKTHMTKMHGINLEAHQSRGGATCDICQKELCSRYFVQVHKQNCHGIRDTAAEPDPRILEETSKDEEGLEICTICTGKFKTPKLLEQHMIGEHGAPKEKKSKSSSSSSSSSAAAAAAAAAVASAAAQLPSIGPTCTLCSQTLPDLLSLRLHMLQAHPLPEQPAPETGLQAQSGADDAKMSSLWIREKLLRYPFGPFPGGFPPFLPGLLPHLAAPPSDTPFPLLPFEMPPGLLAQRAAAAAAAAAASRSPERESEAPPAPPVASAASTSTAATGTAAGALPWEAPGSSGGLSETERPATLVKPEQPISGDTTPRRRHPTAASRLHRCAPCGLRFRRRVHFLQHWQQRHSRSRPEAAAAATAIVNTYLKRRRRCRRCGFAARGRGTLLRHERNHHRRAAPPARCLYGLPLPTPDDTSYRMQSFVMSSTSADGVGVIAPALAALPTMQPLTAPAELNVHLLPV